jgi:hypothetical protein
MRKHLLTIALILTGAPGCDNVGWGGIDIELAAPRGGVESTPAAIEEATPANASRVPGPLLLAGFRAGERGTFVVVGEVVGAGLRTYPDAAFPEDKERLLELTAPGSEWILFSEGVRVGRLITELAGPAGDFCGGRLAISGIVELVPTAAAAERMLALPSGAVRNRPHEAYRELAHTYEQRVATLAIAGDAIPRYGAPWPALGTLDARADIQSFQLRGTAGPSVAATFVSGDEVRVGPPGSDAWALFIVGQEQGGAYHEMYSWYRSAAQEGKGVPRFFDHLDWDGDGTDEILLDVFGESGRWFAALARRDEAWVRTFQDGCGPA